MPRPAEADRNFWPDRTIAPDGDATTADIAARPPITAKPAPTIAAVDDDASAQAAVCPLCENHCPLDAPSCGKGRAYARAAQGAPHE